MNKKPIFLSLAAVLITELAAVGYYLTRPLPVPKVVHSPIQGGAVLSVLPNTGVVKANEEFFVKIQLDTGGQATDGARAVLRFDPNFLRVKEINHQIAVYANYPIRKIDNTKGEVVVSGIINPTDAPFQGQGVLATLKLEALQAGQTALSFVFAPNETTDSNVALHGEAQDILLKAEGAVYQIQQ